MRLAVPVMTRHPALRTLASALACYSQTCTPTTEGRGMNRPARREVGRALAFTIAGRLADARDSLRRLRAFDDRQRWLVRRDRVDLDAPCTQLPLPLVIVGGREEGGYPHTPKVLLAGDPGCGS